MICIFLVYFLSTRDVPFSNLNEQIHPLILSCMHGWMGVYLHLNG